MSAGRGRWGSGWGLGAVSEEVGWGEWARLVPTAVVRPRWGPLWKETGRRGLNVSGGTVLTAGGGGQRLVESGSEGGGVRGSCERTQEASAGEEARGAREGRGGREEGARGLHLEGQLEEGVVAERGGAWGGVL